MLVYQHSQIECCQRTICSTLESRRPALYEAAPYVRGSFLNKAKEAGVMLCSLMSELRVSALGCVIHHSYPSAWQIFTRNLKPNAAFENEI